MTTRRGFLGAILAAGCAPAIVSAGSLMKIVVPRPVWPAPDWTTYEFSNEVWNGGLRSLGENWSREYVKHGAILVRREFRHVPSVFSLRVGA